MDGCALDINRMKVTVCMASSHEQFSGGPCVHREEAGEEACVGTDPGEDEGAAQGKCRYVVQRYGKRLIMLCDTCFLTLTLALRLEFTQLRANVV